MNDFKFELGDEVKDVITGYSGVVMHRTQWLHGCNTYGLQPRELDKDGAPVKREVFDEPGLKLKKAKVAEASRKTGGPARPLRETNRF